MHIRLGLGILNVLWMLSGVVYAEEATQQGPKVYIQLGAFDSEEKAKAVLGVLSHLGPIQLREWPKTQEGEHLYRVLVGPFESEGEAEAYVVERHLRALFPEVWIRVLELDSRYREIRFDEAAVPNPIQRRKPYTLELNLFCHEDRERKGKYVTQLSPEATDEEGKMEVTVNWDCAPDVPINGQYTGGGLEPSYFSLTPLAGYSALSGNYNGTKVSPSGLLYGAQVTGFKNFDGIGAGVEYRFLKRGNNSIYLDGSSTFEHRAHSFIRFKLWKYGAFETNIGFLQNRFVSGVNAGSGTFTQRFLPEVGFRLRQAILRFDRGVGLELGGGWNYIFSAQSNGSQIFTGQSFVGELRSRFYYTRKLASDWFFEFEYEKQNATSLIQSEMSFVFGFSMSWVP